MTISDDELARLESVARRVVALEDLKWVQTDTGTTADMMRAGREWLELVAEVRRLNADLDLSERARATMLSAVGEVDALRAENERLRKERDESEGARILNRNAIKIQQSLVAEARAENERLRDLLDKAQSSGRVVQDERNELRAENERLREVDQRLRESTGKLYTATLAERDAAIAEAAELRAENERLRKEHTALEEAHGTVVRERDAAARSLYDVMIERNELRASLADAVGKIAAMEPLVDAVRAWRAIYRQEQIGVLGSVAERFDAYEASLPGIVKVGP